MFVGRHPEEGESLVMVDDVITDGETKLEAVALLRETFSAPIDALVIAFDRMERSSTDRNAIRDFEAETGIPVHALITLADLELLVAEQTAGEAERLACATLQSGNPIQNRQTGESVGNQPIRSR